MNDVPVNQTPHSSRDDASAKGRIKASFAASCLAFYKANWFLFWLAIILTAGMAFPRAFETVLTESIQTRGQNAVVFFVMFMMSLALPTDALLAAFKQPLPTFLAVGLNWVVTPLLALATVPLLHHEFRGGLLLAAAMPCSMASASVWTRRAGGNDAISLMVTVVTNGTCFAITPLLVWMMTGRTVPFQVWDKISELALLVLLPLLLGQAARRFDTIRAFCDRNRLLLGVITQTGLLFVILLGAIKTGHRLHAPTATSPTLAQIALMICAVLTIHTAVLILGLWLSGALKISRPNSLAVAIAGSQKTLMIGLPMAGELQTSILPLVTFHAGQLLIDAVFAERQRKVSTLGSHLPLPTQKVTQ